jgi:hypothetical protein
MENKPQTQDQETAKAPAPVQPARYLVTMPPGAPVPGVGFVKAGDIFTAPSADYVPSRTFRPLNQEAQQAIEDVFDELGAVMKERLQDAPGEKKGQIRREFEALAKEREKVLKLVELPKAESKVEKGIPLSQLSQLESGADRTL